MSSIKIGGRNNRRAVLASFSGIDGAGKSTQIDALCTAMAASGLRFLRFVFWEDVATLARLREFGSYVLFNGDRGVGTPQRPAYRRDKNVRSWYLTGARLFLYLLDAIRLRIVVTTARRRDTDAILFDRYIYDEIANLPLQRWIVRVYVRALLKIVPTPDVAYLLDADPATAYERKPEYPLDFLHSSRMSYLALSKFVSGMKVIERMPIINAEQKVAEELFQKLPLVSACASRDTSVNSTGCGP